MKKRSATNQTGPQESALNPASDSPAPEKVRRARAPRRVSSDSTGLEFRRKLHLLRSLRLAGRDQPDEFNFFRESLCDEYRDEYDLIAAQMVTLADRVELPEQLIDEFDQAWKGLIQPVIDSGTAYDNPGRNWYAFALLIRYLQDEGIWLPVCSKPWIAALRLL